MAETFVDVCRLIAAEALTPSFQEADQETRARAVAGYFAQCEYLNDFQRRKLTMFALGSPPVQSPESSQESDTEAQGGQDVC
jgi:hypothetical protein